MDSKMFGNMLEEEDIYDNLMADDDLQEQIADFKMEQDFSRMMNSQRQIDLSEGIMEPEPEIEMDFMDKIDNPTPPKTQAHHSMRQRPASIEILQDLSDLGVEQDFDIDTLKSSQRQRAAMPKDSIVEDLGFGRHVSSEIPEHLRF